MNDLELEKESKLPANPTEAVIKAHEFLVDFINNYETAQRGGIHDFVEILLFNMISKSIININTYLKGGKTNVEATEIMQIILDSYQGILDKTKRNIEDMDSVYLKKPRERY